MLCCTVILTFAQFHSSFNISTPVLFKRSYKKDLFDDACKYLLKANLKTEV